MLDPAWIKKFRIKLLAVNPTGVPAEARGSSENCHDTATVSAP